MNDVLAKTDSIALTQLSGVYSLSAQSHDGLRLCSVSWVGSIAHAKIAVERLAQDLPDKADNIMAEFPTLMAAYRNG